MNDARKLQVLLIAGICCGIVALAFGLSAQEYVHRARVNVTDWGRVVLAVIFGAASILSFATWFKRS